MNAGDVKAKLATSGGRADLMSKSDSPIAERVSDLYRMAFSRTPSEDELRGASEYLSVGPTAERFQDLIWALINSKEFLFNH
jgi:hypothetical protein